MIEKFMEGMHPIVRVVCLAIVLIFVGAVLSGFKELIVTLFYGRAPLPPPPARCDQDCDGLQKLYE